MTQKWIDIALEMGFSHAVPLDPAKLTPREDIRAMGAADRCGAYGKNWSCPPYCGDLDACAATMGGYRQGILLQTVGQLKKDIDTRGYRLTEQQHLEQFAQFCRILRQAHPEALCLGTGGCRVCGKCAWPKPCRFPELAMSSMEAYGLFVTQVCRDAGLPYHHGPRTVTYTACVLF